MDKFSFPVIAMLLNQALCGESKIKSNNPNVKTFSIPTLWPSPLASLIWWGAFSSIAYINAYGWMKPNRSSALKVGLDCVTIYSSWTTSQLYVLVLMSSVTILFQENVLVCWNTLLGVHVDWDQPVDPAIDLFARTCALLYPAYTLRSVQPKRKFIRA